MQMKEILNLSVAKLKRLAALKSKIERLQSQLEAIVTNGAKAPTKTPVETAEDERGRPQKDFPGRQGALGESPDWQIKVRIFRRRQWRC